jgi:hypothetical protein
MGAAGGGYGFAVLSISPEVAKQWLPTRGYSRTAVTGRHQPDLKREA